MVSEPEFWPTQLLTHYMLVITLLGLTSILYGASNGAGATMVPELGFWHSAANSVYMAECPNQQACLGDRTNLQTCQTAAYAPPSLNGSTLVCCAWLCDQWSRAASRSSGSVLTPDRVNPVFF